MEISTRHGLIQEGNWKPSHHDAHKSLILRSKKKKPKKSQTQHRSVGSEWASLSKTILFLPPQKPCIQLLALLPSPLSGHVTAKREVGRSTALRWQAGGGNSSGRGTRKSTFASRESSASAGSWAGSPAAPRASAGSSTPPSLELLSADAERSNQAPSSFGGWGLTKNLGAGGLNLENNITWITDLQREGGKPAHEQLLGRMRPLGGYWWCELSNGSDPAAPKPGLSRSTPGAAQG